MTKQEIRSLLRAMRSACPERESEAVFEKIEQLPSFRSASSVLLYWSMPSELATHDFIKKWSRCKRILLPRVAGQTLDICEYSQDNMVPGFRGILEPSQEAPLCSPDEVNLAIVPGLGFDRQCHRLGRGGGFYDRLLPALSCPKIAVAFEHQLVPEVPVENWDAPVDMVVTSSEIFVSLQNVKQ